MIKRVGDQWTTIQCKNLVSDDGKICNLCFKVLNDRFALTQRCPYCLQEIDHHDWAKAEEARKSPPPTTPKDADSIPQKEFSSLANSMARLAAEEAQKIM